MDLDFDLESRCEVITRAGGRDGVLFVIETARTQTFGSDVHKKKKHCDVGFSSLNALINLYQ